MENLGFIGEFLGDEMGMREEVGGGFGGYLCYLVVKSGKKWAAGFLGFWSVLYIFAPQQKLSPPKPTL